MLRKRISPPSNKSHANNSEKRTKFSHHFENSDETIVAEFTDVMEGSQNLFVDPHSCVPLTKIRSLSKSGVNRLMHLLDNSLNGAANAWNVGITLGTDTPIIVKLNGNLQDYVHEYWKGEMGFSEEEVKKN